MDEEIKQLQARLQELEQKKREEEERNKDPFRFLRERIERRDRQIVEEEENIKNPARQGGSPKQRHLDAIALYMHENKCDLAIIQAIENLQEELNVVQDEHRHSSQTLQSDIQVLRAELQHSRTVVETLREDLGNQVDKLRNQLESFRTTPVENLLG